METVFEVRAAADRFCQEALQRFVGRGIKEADAIQNIQGSFNQCNHSGAVVTNEVLRMG
jgi:hypothetical protein